MAVEEKKEGVNERETGGQGRLEGLEDGRLNV